MTWETVVGLEIHARMLTRGKIFSPAASGFCDSPNVNISEVDLGMPGALPVLNRAAVECAARMGLALGGTVNAESEFARKNYFYPDLPKGYQISQYDHPIVSGGEVWISVDGAEKRVGVTRAHLEEDAGKLLHEEWDALSGVDLNRAGAPLLEIVSEPEMRSAAEASAYAREMRRLARWLRVCDGEMQEGSFRVDANVSVRRPGDELGTRCEIKNLNSFRFLEQAIAFEAARQIRVLEEGGEVRQETRLFDSAKGETRAMRGKEDAQDYRYFPDPDLPVLRLSPEWIEEVRRAMPELPRARAARFVAEHGLGEAEAALLTSERALSDFYEAAAEKTGKGLAKACANWIAGDLAALVNKSGKGIEASRVSAAALADLLLRTESGEISGKTAKEVLEKMWATGEDAGAIVSREGLGQISDAAELERLAREIAEGHPKQAAEYRGGKERLFGFFIGRLMAATKGRANPKTANELMRKILDEGKGE